VVIHFSTSACVHSYTVADLRIHPNRLQIHTQVVTLAGPRAGVLGASSHACLGPAASEGGPMTRGLGRIPRIRGTLTQARDEAGNDMSAGRYTPTSGRTGHPTDGTGGKGKTEGSPGRRRPGLAPGASGWPWHPRRLATARHRGTRGGLVGAVAHATNAARPHGSGPVIAVMVRTPHHEDSRCGIRLGIDYDVAWPANRASPGRDPRGGVTRSAARKGTSGTGLITVSWVLCDRPPAQAARERGGRRPGGAHGGPSKGSFACRGDRP
jgi:hypothetical protein